MFSSSEQISHVARDLIEDQLATVNGFMLAALDAGVQVVELNVDTLKTALAAATVSTRQWLSAAGDNPWLGAYAQPHSNGQLALALPAGRHPLRNVGSAADSSLE